MSTEYHAASASLAAAGNDSLAEALLAALRADSAVDSVRVTDVSVSPIRNASDKVVGYAAATTIDYITRHLDSIAPLLTRALQAGATGVGRVTFESDSERAAHAQALALAFRNAEAEATALAAASGHRLGGLIDLSAHTPWVSPTVGYADAVVGGRGAPIPGIGARPVVVQVGPTPRAIEVEADVGAKWHLLRQ